MSDQTSNRQQNGNAVQVLDHGGYGLSNQLDTLLNNCSDSSTVKLAKHHCKQLQQQHQDQPKSKKQQQINAQKNFCRLINETKPCSESKEIVTNQSFHKPKLPVRFGRRAVPLGIDAQYENVIHSNNENSLSHDRWSTTRSPTKQDINRSYQLNLQLSLSDSKNHIIKNNNSNDNNNSYSNTTDVVSAFNKNSKPAEIGQVVTENKDSCAIEHVERRRSRRPTITNVTVTPLHHTVQHVNTNNVNSTKKEALLMKLPRIASNTVNVITSSKGVFSTQKNNKNTHRAKPAIDLSLISTKTKKANSTHLAPINTTTTSTSTTRTTIIINNNTSVNNTVRISNKDNKNSASSTINKVNAAAIVEADYFKQEKSEKTADKATKLIATTATTRSSSLSQLQYLFDMHHLISDDHDKNNSINNVDQNVIEDRSGHNANDEYEIQRQIRQLVPVGKVCAQSAKLNAMLTQNTDVNNIITTIKKNESNNDKDNKNKYITHQNQLQVNKEVSDKQNADSCLVCGTHSTSSTVADATNVTNKHMKQNVVGKQAHMQQNYTLPLVRELNEKKQGFYDKDNNSKKTIKKLHNNGLTDDREDKCGLTTSRHSSRRKSNNADTHLQSIPIDNTALNVNVSIKTQHDNDKTNQPHKSKKPPLNQQSKSQTDKESSKIVSGNTAAALQTITTNDTQSKWCTNDKCYLPQKMQHIQQPVVRNKCASRRVLMSATDTTSLFTQHTQKRAAAQRAKLLAWQDVCLFGPNLPCQPVNINQLQNGICDDRTKNSKTGKIAANIFNASNVNSTKLSVSCHQRYSAMYGVDADGSRQNWAEIAGEAVEMDARLHNILAQLHHYNRPDQTQYPAQLPMTVDLVQHRRRPHTPRSFYGVSGPILGASWFKGALDNTLTIDSPNLTSLQQKEEMQKMTARGLVDRRNMCQPANNERHVNNIVYQQNAYTTAINAKQLNHNVNNVARVTNPSKPVNARNPYLDMAIYNTMQR